MKQNGMTYEYHELPGVDHGVVITQGTPLIYEFFAKHSKAEQRSKRKSRSND